MHGGLPWVDHGGSWEAPGTHGRCWVPGGRGPFRNVMVITRLQVLLSVCG